MENFTDIFGEDLANLEDLGNLGGFPGGPGGAQAGGPGGMDQGGPPGGGPGMQPGGPAGAPGMQQMSSHGPDAAAAYSQQQQQFQQQQQQQYSGYRPGAPGSAGGHPQQYSGYSNGPAPGYSSNPGNYSGSQGMMSGGPAGGGRQQQQQGYSGYPPTQGSMASWQQGQGMMPGPRMYGQPGYPPSGPGMPGHYPGYDQRSGGTMNYRQGYPQGYPGSGGQGMPQGYPGQGAMPGYHQAAAGMKAGYPPTSSQHSGMPGGPYGSAGSGQSTGPGGVPNQYANAAASQYHMTPGSGQYPGQMPGSQPSRGQQGSHPGSGNVPGHPGAVGGPGSHPGGGPAGPGGHQSSVPGGHMPGQQQQPNMSPAQSQQGMPVKGMMQPGGPGMGPGGMPRSMSGQVLSPSSPAMGPGGMPSQMMPGGGSSMPPTSMPMSVGSGGPHMSPSGMVMSQQQSGNQQPPSSQQMAGNTPGAGGSSPMYRSPFPPQPSPSQQQQHSPHSQASPMPQRSPLPPSTNSPAALTQPYSPVTSPAPPRTPSSVQGRMTPTGGPSTPGQQQQQGGGSASSLQQLEQMVMPGSTSKAPDVSQQQARSSPLSQVGSPLGPGSLKTPLSPAGMRGPGNPLSPQQWGQPGPMSGQGGPMPGAGGQYPGPGGMHGMYPGFQQHPGMPGGGGGMTAANLRMPHPAMAGYPGPNMGGMPGMDHMKGAGQMQQSHMPKGHLPHSASSNTPQGQQQHSQHHQQHPSQQQQHKAMSSNTPSGGPGMGRNSGTEEMPMAGLGGGQILSKGGLSAGPGRPGPGGIQYSAGNLPPGAMPLGQQHGNIPGMPQQHGPPMGAMDPSAYQQSHNRLQQQQTPTSESLSVPHTQQQQQQHMMNQLHQQQIQPSTTMLPHHHDRNQQQHELSATNKPQQQQQQQPSQMQLGSPQHSAALGSTTMLSEQQRSHHHQHQYDQDYNQADSQQTELPTSKQQQHSEKTTTSEVDDHVSSQTNIDQHPESTVVSASLQQQQQQPQQSDEPESSTERAVPTSTSGDDGELDELKDEGKAIAREAEGSGGEEDDRPDTTVKQSPPSHAVERDTEQQQDSTLTTPPPPPVSDASAPSTSTVGMPQQQQPSQQQQQPEKSSMMVPPGIQQPGGPPAVRGSFPAPPHGYPGPTMGGPEAPRPGMMMGPKGGPAGPVGSAGMYPGGPGGFLPPGHPVMMEMQALHQHMQQLYSQPQNQHKSEMMAELQSHMRKLQAQASQLAAASWPGPHPGPPMPAAPKGSLPAGGQMSLGQMPAGGPIPTEEQIPAGGQMPTEEKMSMPADSLQKEQLPISAAAAETAKSDDGSQETDGCQPSGDLPISEPLEDPYAENFEEESMAEFRKKNTKKPRERKPKAEKDPNEEKTPKKRGPKPKIKLDENGLPIEAKPKRQYNRKKKPEPGALDEDLEKILVPPEPMIDQTPQPVEDSSDQHNVENGEIDAANNSEAASTSAGSTAIGGESTAVDGESSPVKQEDVAETTPVTEEKKKSPAQPKLKANTPKRPKPNKTLLSFSKKKRKRNGSENSDLDDNIVQTPPPSPPEEEGIEKRRSGRNTKRKKYVEDIPFTLNEEDLKKLPKDAVIPTAALDDILGPEDSEPGTADTSMNEGDTSIASQSGPNYAFVDPTSEDTMIVQIVLGCRTATREIEEEEDEEVTKAKVEDTSTNESPTKEKDASDDTVKDQVKDVKPTSDDGENEAKTSEKTAVSTDDKTADDSLKEKSADSLTADSTDDKPADSKDNSKTTDKNNEDITMSDNTEIKKAGDEKAPVDTPKKPAKTVQVEEYLVKFKNFSYLHCQWLTEPELLKGDKRVTNKIKRFHQKRLSSGNVLDFSDEEPFNPDYIEVDRVLDQSQHTDEDTDVTTKHYLVKWRSLPYEDCTWELEADVDPEKIKDYLRWKDPPTEKKLDKPRGKKSEWVEFKESPDFKHNNKLREYQLEGVNWLNFSWFNQRNCLLADEMGLGKTIQSLAWVHSIWKYGIRGPFLVIAPLSTIPNWQREFELWTDMNVIVYHGSQTSRNMIQEYEMHYKDENGERIPNLFKFHVLITTYECIITDIMDLKDISWRACVIDEAHRLKNQKCKLLEGLKLLKIEARLLLSGTPLQNNISELFSLLSFLEPAQFTNIDEFNKDFGDMQNEEQVLKLQVLLKPLMLRRMKEDVEKSLKPKEETIVEVELTNIQKKYYRGILERNFSFLKSSSYSNVPNLMNTMMELRKCCIHPYLLKGAEESIQTDYRQSKKDYSDEDDLYYKALVHASGKMVLLDKLLPKLKANGNRVLIFSQMVKMLDILEDYLIRKKYPFERIDGRIRGNLRQAAIDRYCRPDSDRFVFLLCTKAGGLGINLTAADTCIIYDSDWNPQNDLQAQARCHRIGQKKMVKIYRLVTKNTYEREMLDRAGLKLGLDKAVLQSMNTSQGGKDTQASNTLSKKEVETLLKKGAYGALMDDDNAGDKFCEEDIEDILSRRATTITHAEEKGSTFSKASFSTSDSATDISIDDPDFWKKWAKKAEIEEIDETMQLMMVEPRNRKRIDRFGGADAGVDSSQVSDLDSSSDSDGEGKTGTPGTPKEGHRETGGRTRDQRIKDKLKSMKQGGGKSKRPRRGNWEEDDDFMEEERDVEYGSWNKSDLFRLEKGVMAYGWGRWEEVLNHAQLRKGWTHEDVEEALRLSCIYSLIIYKGDENIKTFMWDLVAPGAGNTVLRNHSGLSAPVPRGRKNKGKNQRDDKPEGADWANDEKYDPELFLDKSYRKHLDRFHNKLLLRIRLLFYIQHEILGDFMEAVNNPNVAATKIPLNVPTPEGFVSGWWDSEADKSLLIGVFRYGFERYSMMRLDPGLCFLKRCGPPDNEAVQAELDNLTKTDDKDLDDEDDDSSSATPSGSGSRPPSVKPEEDQHNSSGFLPFPEYSNLNSRIRKLVSAFQRENKKEEARQAAKEKREERRERIEQVMREREKQKVEQQQRKWSRREESNFLRTILAFGVDKKDKKYNWDRFRLLGRLETKYEDTMTEYYLAFMSMCKRVAGESLSEEEELVSASVEPVGQDKARKVLERVDFLSRLRENVVVLPDLADRLEELAEPALDLPAWWIPGKHDADLVVGAARHGVARMEYFVLNDIELSFKDILKRSLSNEPLVAKAELAAWEKRYNERKQNGAKSPAESADNGNADAKKNGKSRHGSGKSDASNGDIVEEVSEEKVENGKKDEEKDTTDNNKDGSTDEPMDTTETDNNSTTKEKDKEKLKVEKSRAIERAAIQAPQLNLQQIEAAIAKGGAGYDHEMINDLMAQTYAASVKWPRDSVLLVRLQHILEAVENNKWPVSENCVLLDLAVDNGTETPVEGSGTPVAGSGTPAGNHARDTSTPLSEMSEVSGYEDANVLTHGGLANRKKRGRRPLDCPEEKTKLRGMLQPSTPLSATSVVSSNKASTEDSLSESSGNRVAAGEETGLSGILDLKSGQSSKGSKLESALDKLGLQKRKLSDAPADDKSKKKKRLDDLLSGLHAGKGNSLPEKKDSPMEASMESMMKKSSESRTDLNKLQEMLGPLGGNPGDAKVQKWLADQMGVTPERPTTPGSSGAANQANKRPASTASSAGGLMEWMSKLSPDEHVSMINRSTGKRLSGSDGPKLKYLPQWLMEHPLYEVDPKWMEEMRLKDESKKKGPGRPNLDDAASKKAAQASSVGPSYNSMASLGLDPKNPMSALAALDPKNPNSLAALYGLDPKKLDPMTAAMLGLGDPKNPMKMDPMMMAALSMDPKMLQSLGIDPKKLASMASPATSKAMDKGKQSSSSSAAASAAAAMAGMDPMMLAAFGMDPKNPKIDPAMAQALGLDPKNPKFDPMVLASLGLDPKNPNSTMLAAMAAMDPNNQLAAMYGLMPPGFPMPSGMDLLGKGKHSPKPKDNQSPLQQPSPRSSSSQREGPSPRPPSRASQSSRDGGRSTPRSSHPASSYAQASPRTTASSSSMFGGMNPFGGLDPKTLASMGLDPKMLAQMDPKMLASLGLDPKMMAMMDPRMASLAGMDLKSLMQMDPKLLQSAGIDPKMLQQMVDPKSMASMFGMEMPKTSMSQSMSGGLDPKLLQSMGIDPKMLAGLDPNMLKSMGIDPKLLGLDVPSSKAGGFDLKSMGLDPKMLAAMDPKLLSDPKFLASLDPKMMFGGMDPKMFGIDPKMFGMSSAGWTSPGGSTSYSRGGNTSTVPTSATGTTMSIPSSSFSGLMDPRLLGLDPKMLQGLDEKALKSLGLDPNIVKSLLVGENPKSNRSSSGSSHRQSSSSLSRPTSSTSTTFAGLDPKMFSGMDPKTLSMMDPKMLAAMSDPKILSAMYGMDMKALASLDPKLLASFGIDPKWLDPKAMGGGSSSAGPSVSSSSAGTSLPPSSMGGIDAKLLASMGIDAKTLAAMDPKVLASYGIDMKTIQALEQQSRAPTPSTSGSTSSNKQDHSNNIAGLDPKLLAAAGIDPKLLAGMDAKTLASLGLDAKSLSAALDPKNIPKSMPPSIDPKMFGLDPKTLASMGIDPKMLSDPKFLASMGLDPKMLAQMGLDPKTLSQMGGMDPKSMQGMGGMDPKMLAQMAMDPKLLASMGLDPKTLASMGLDPKMLASLDPKALAAMGMDPKAMSAAMGMDPKSMSAMGLDPKALSAMGIDPKALSAMGLDAKTLSAMGIDPKALSAMGMDPKTLSAMGIDPKALSAMGMDPKTLQAMGMDPKSLSAMGMDPKVLSAMGIDHKTLHAMGMDPKALSAMGMDPKTLQSMGMDPKTLQAMGMDPKALQAMGMDPKTLQAMGMDPKALQAMGMDPKTLQAMGMDPKTLQAMGMDPKTLQSMGMDPKALQAMGMDPKTLQSMGMDPKTLSAMGMDPKALSAIGIDPKTLQAMGIDPKTLGAMGMDPKTLQAMGMDPKTLQAMGMDPKTLQAMGMDPKALSQMTAGMDPKLLASMGMDPKSLAAMGMDPKMLASMGMDPKALSSMAAGMDPKLLASMGMDPKSLASIDPKILASMGIDPKMASDPNLMAMYAMGMPGMMPPMSMANGVGSAGTPIPGTSKGGNSGAPAKPKPGTVAAALQEKKESEKTRSEVGSVGGSNASIHEEGPVGSNDDKAANPDVITEEEEVRRGLTSEERVLLREKKKERLMKEVESESGSLQAGPASAATDEGGLNLSVSSSRHSDHPSSTKLEALLNKPIDEPSPSSIAVAAPPPTIPVVSAADDRPLSNGDVTSPPPTGGDNV